MSEDAVSRKEVKLALCRAVHPKLQDEQLPCINQTVSCLWSKTRVCDYVREIDNLPSVISKQTEGEWLYYHGDNVQGFYGHPYCSECYRYAPFKIDGSAAISPFCPNCGAKMKV